jgi:predicted DNA-binding protein with PD1-like motif
MQATRLDAPGERTYALILQTGDEVIETLTRFARENGLDAAHFTALGAFERATLAYFDWGKRAYEDIPVEEQVEVLVLVGDIALAPEGGPKVHAHAVVGKRDGTAHGGHVQRGVVRPTLEVVLTESPKHLRRRMDPEAGIALIDLGTPAGGAER